ncbi:hypothetical protein FLL95_00805 [Vibrio cholerae]|nr:hypothetical protein FLL95_00805 [Vibrio cholerae]
MSVNFDVFIKNLLRLWYEKILLLTSVNLWGDYHYMATHTYSTYAAYDDPNSLRVPCGSFVMLATQEEVDSYGRDVICNQ